MSDVQFYIRGDNTLQKEKVMAEGLIKWSCQSAMAKPFNKLLFKSAFLSNVLGKYFSSSLSKGKIKSTIKDLDIQMSDFIEPESGYKHFNDFFTRHINKDCRPFDNSKNTLISPADGRVLVFPELKGDTLVHVKGCKYSVDQLLNRDAKEYHNGALAVIRLCPADYHRFHFPCEGNILETVDINGAYYSVNPIVLEQGMNVFCENKRAYTIIDNPELGKVCYMEVGAFGVGSIKNTYKGNTVTKMQEKGYFEFGGSTVVLVFEPNKIKFSQDLIEHSKQGYETFLKVGETMGITGESDV